MKKSIVLFIFVTILVMISLTLSSCGAPNSDPDKALDSLKSNGIDWAKKDTVAMPIAFSGLGINGVDAVILGSGEIDGEAEFITIIYFDSDDDANESWEKAKEMSDEDKANYGDRWICEKSGRMIYFGTKAAIKAAG